jgi:hypothetical protein
MVEAAMIGRDSVYGASAAPLRRTTRSFNSRGQRRLSKLPIYEKSLS